jgi:hypothetical protein
MTFTQRTKKWMASTDRCDHDMVGQARVAGLSRSICTKCGQITLVNLSVEAADRRARARSAQTDQIPSVLH